MQHYYGLDIGGSKIELVACDETLEVAHRRRIETPQQGYDVFLQSVVELVRATDDELDGSCRGVGIALPGVMDRSTGRQLSANVPALTGQTVGHDLRQLLQRPLHLGNDLQCFALSEAHDGAAAGYASMFGVILGTGAGGGYCIEGRIVTGHNGIAGEWGHWTLPATLLTKHELPVFECGCGLRGCLERYVSGSGLTAIHQHFSGDAHDAATVIACAQHGDAIAQRALDIHRNLLGHAFASVIMALDPHVIVLGGGLSKHQPLYRELPAVIETYLFKGVRVPPILPSRFGDAGGARGAALLARQHQVAS